MAEDGVNFPLDKDGKRSTTEPNQGAFAAAVKNYSQEAHAAVTAEKKWRFGYAKHVLKQTQLAAESEEKALGIATDGLAYLHSAMVFVRGGDSQSLGEAMKTIKGHPWTTHTIKGSQSSSGGSFEMPYHGKTLRGQEINAQVETWVRRGVIEIDTGNALCRMADNSELLDLSGHTFVLFGAGSAMGPFPILMALGAHVVALDLDRPGIWKRLIGIARASPGKLTFPVKGTAPSGATDEALAEIAGCNLITQTPEIRNWLLDSAGPLAVNAKDRVVLGAYGYLDGPLFVRLSMAMDAIIADVVRARDKNSKPAIAYLCTPTDAHVCTQTSVDAARENLKKSTWWQSLLSKVLPFAKMPMSSNVIRSLGDALPVCDAIVKDQGPNYILAKRLQHWRAILSRKDNCIVSSNIAPATATASVVSNKMFALAYNGMHNFKPMEVFKQETSNAVMAGLLIHDLKTPTSAAHPEVHLANPMQLFSRTAFHGGAWRCGWKFNSIGAPSAISFLVSAYLVKTYLVIYNLLQCAGWGFALSLFLQQPFGTEGGTPVWSRPGSYITPCTYLQLLEIAHSALGMVPSNPLTTAMQITSRVIVMQVMNCDGVADVQNGGVWTSLFIGSWCVTEVIRYLFLALSTVGIKIPPLTFIRYSTFLPLYPLGVSGELGSMFRAGPVLDKLAASSCGLSNFPALVHRLGFVPIFLIWAACLPMLYSLLLAQRKKALGGGGKGGSSKSKKA